MKKMFRNLRGRMESHGITMEELAIKMKVSNTYLSKRFNGHIPFTAIDIYVICAILKISHDKITEYFPEDEIMVAARVKSA